MKKILAVLTLLAAVSFSYAQSGTLQFANSGTTRFTTNVNGNIGNLTTGAVYTVGLYIGTAGSTSNQLQLAGTTTISPVASLAGVFNGGNPFTVNTNTFPFATAGATVVVQVRAWSTAGGADYATAYSAALGNGNILVGATGLTTIVLGGGSTGPTALFGASSPQFTTGAVLTSIAPTPEPTTILLGCLGGAALLVARRRK